LGRVREGGWVVLGAVGGGAGGVVAGGVALGCRVVVLGGKKMFCAQEVGIEIYRQVLSHSRNQDHRSASVGKCLHVPTISARRHRGNRSVQLLGDRAPRLHCERLSDLIENAVHRDRPQFLRVDREQPARAKHRRWPSLWRFVDQSWCGTGNDFADPPAWRRGST